MTVVKLRPSIFILGLFLILFACTQDPIQPIKPVEETSPDELKDRLNKAGRTGCSAFAVYSDDFTVTRVEDEQYWTTFGGRYTKYIIEVLQIQGDLFGNMMLVHENPGVIELVGKRYYYEDDLNANGIIEGGEIIYRNFYEDYSNNKYYHKIVNEQLCGGFSGKFWIEVTFLNNSNRDYAPIFHLESLFQSPYLPAYFGGAYNTLSNSVTCPGVHKGFTYLSPTQWFSPHPNFYAVENSAFYSVNEANGNRTLSTYIDMSGAEGIAATEKYIWFVKNDQIYRVGDDGSGTYFKSMAFGWGGTEIMAGSKDYLFTVHQGTLYRTDANTADGNTISLGGGWGGTEAMCVAPSHVYAIQGGHLWRQNKSVVAYTDLGGGWAGAEAMTYNNGYLYIVHQDKLKRVNVNTGATSVVEAYGWTGTKGLASLNDGQYVYAIQGGYLWRTSVTGGSTAIGPADWQNAQYFFARNKTF